MARKTKCALCVTLHLHISQFAYCEFSQTNCNKSYDIVTFSALISISMELYHVKDIIHISKCQRALTHFNRAFMYKINSLYNGNSLIDHVFPERFLFFIFFI